MSALLCRTIKTYVEPPTLDNVIAGSCVELHSNHIHLATKLAGPKVFLYRRLPAQIGGWMQMMLKQPGLEEGAEDALRTIEMMLTVKNLMFIESNDFFNDVRGTMDKVSKHFHIPEIKDLGWANHNVKNLGLQDIQLAPVRLPPAPDGVGDFTAKDGIIDPDEAMTIPPIANIVNKLRKKYPHLSEYM
tara:strand:+ start:193 stop:756 length:564 start_codon:yes stop_codon:yes gene_type:complete